MSNQSLEKTYIAYLNALDNKAYNFVAMTFMLPTVVHNGSTYTSSQYVEMIKQNMVPFPDTKFDPVMLVVDEEKQTLAARIMFNGPATVKPFYENVIYKFEGKRIAEVWSVVEEPEMAKA